MSRFTDGAGREWTFQVTVLTVKRVRDQAGIDLLELMEPGSAAFEKLADDVVGLCEVMLAFLDDQFEEAGLTHEDFLRSLDSEDVVREATRACLEAILSFSRKPKAKLMKTAFGKVWEATEKRERVQLKQARELIESPQFDQMVQSVAESVLPGRPSSA